MKLPSPTTQNVMPQSAELLVYVDVDVMSETLYTLKHTVKLLLLFFAVIML